MHSWKLSITQWYIKRELQGKHCQIMYMGAKKIMFNHIHTHCISTYVCIDFKERNLWKMLPSTRYDKVSHSNYEKLCFILKLFQNSISLIFVIILFHLILLWLSFKFHFSFHIMWFKGYLMPHSPLNLNH